jgi:vacuolar-type H+-ATPase subunit E/Vma4
MMDSIEEKLKKFRDLVLEEANNKKEDMISNAEQEREVKLDEHEIQLLKNAYNKIHKAIEEQDKKSSEEISAALLKSRKELFLKREEISNKLYGKVLDYISEFMRTENYIDYLYDAITEAIKHFKSDDICIEFMEKDSHIADILKERLKADIKVTFIKEDFIGGCIISSLKEKTCMNLSFFSMLEDIKNKFILLSELNIDEF